MGDEPPEQRNLERDALRQTESRSLGLLPELGQLFFAEGRDDLDLRALVQVPAGEVARHRVVSHLDLSAEVGECEYVF